MLVVFDDTFDVVEEDAGVVDDVRDLIEDSLLLSDRLPGLGRQSERSLMRVDAH